MERCPPPKQSLMTVCGAQDCDSRHSLAPSHWAGDRRSLQILSGKKSRCSSQPSKPLMELCLRDLTIGTGQPVASCSLAEGRGQANSPALPDKENIHSGSGSGCSSFVTNGVCNTLSVTKEAECSRFLGLLKMCVYMSQGPSLMMGFLFLTYTSGPVHGFVHWRGPSA